MEPEQRLEAGARIYDGNIAKGNARTHFGDSHAVYQFSSCNFNGTYIGEGFVSAAGMAPQDVPVVPKNPTSASRLSRARNRDGVVQDAVPGPPEERTTEVPALPSQGIDQPELRNTISEVRPPRAQTRRSVVRDAVPRPIEKGIPEIPALAPQGIDQPELSSSRLQIPRTAQPRRRLAAQDDSKEINQPELSSPRLPILPRAITRRPVRAPDDSASQPAPDPEQGVTVRPSLPTVRVISQLIAAVEARSTRLTSNTIDIPNRDGMMEQDGSARNFGSGIYRARYAYSWKSVSGQGHLREGELVLVGVEDRTPNYCTKVTGICGYELGETAWISKRGLLERAPSIKTYETARYDVKLQMKDHLAISKGDIVKVYGKRGKTWLVKLGYAFGIVPASAFEFDPLDSVFEMPARRWQRKGVREADQDPTERTTV